MAAFQPASVHPTTVVESGGVSSRSMASGVLYYKAICAGALSSALCWPHELVGEQRHHLFAGKWVGAEAPLFAAADLFVEHWSRQSDRGAAAWGSYPLFHGSHHCLWILCSPCQGAHQNRQEAPSLSQSYVSFNIPRPATGLVRREHWSGTRSHQQFLKPQRI